MAVHYQDQLVLTFFLEDKKTTGGVPGLDLALLSIR